MKCRVENYSHTADATGQAFIKCTATFIEEISLPAVFAAGGPGVQTLGGSQDVRINADESQLTLETLGLPPSDALTEAVAVAEKWEQDPFLTAREVITEMQSTVNALNADLNTLDAYTDIDRYPLIRDYTRLQHSLRKTAESFTAVTTRIVIIDVTEPLPLRVIASRFYGAEQSERRFAEMRELNSELKSVVIVPRGTQLKALSPGVLPGTFGS